MRLLIGMSASLSLAIAGAPVMAQSEPAPMLVAQPVVATNQVFLPANTELVLRTNDELTSSSARTGDTFSLSLVHDVMIAGQIVIPRGSRAIGEVTFRTGKGAFGKSGKMDIAMRYLEVSGQRVPIEGTFRQEGEGNTVATVAGVIAVGVFAGFITGRTAVIPRGRELTVHTSSAIPVALAAVAPAQLPAIAGASVRLASAPVTPERRSGENCRTYGQRVGGTSAIARIVEERCQGSR